MKCWNSGLNAPSSRIFIVAIHTPTIVIASRHSGKKQRQNEIQIWPNLVLI
jgi:hypothetical protein